MIPARSWIPLLFAGLCASAARAPAPAVPEGQSERTSRARAGAVELGGPLESAIFESAGARTRVRARLVRGERLVVQLPFASARPDPVRPPRLVALEPEGGRAQFVAWAAPPTPPSARLAGRARAPLRPAAPRPRSAALAAALGLFALVLGLRRRPPLALAVGVAGALVLARGPWVAGGWRPSARVLEGGPEGWLAVDSAYGRLEMEPDPAPWIETSPASAALAFDATLAPSGVRWGLEAEGALVHRVRSFDAAGLALEPTANRWADLEAVWTREAGGLWRFRGAWPAGAPLPPEIGPQAPPGWLVVGLPSGGPGLVGRFAAAAPPAVWIRIADPAAIGGDRR